MKSSQDKSCDVAIAQRVTGDGIAEVIADELIALGHHPVHFQIGSPIPESAEVVFSFGPYGRFLTIPRQLAHMPSDQRPVFVHWNTEGIPDPKIPWQIMSRISGWRSWLGRIQEYRNGPGIFPGTERFFSLLESRMLRFRYVGDYYYAHYRQWMDVFADSSEVYADFHRRHGLPTIVAPWGATPRWYEDLRLDRDIDVLWMGKRGARRRSQLLDRVRAELDARGVRMHIADGEENPFIFGEERIRYLNRSKITLNITRTWYDDNFSRFAMAAPNRSLIISEPVLPHCPSFKPGVHYVSSPVRSLAEAILYYLDHESERLHIVEKAYQLVTNELTFQASIKAIMESVQQAHLAKRSVFPIPSLYPSSLRQPLNVLMVSPQPFFEPRGTPISVYERLRALSSLGHEIDLVTYHVGKDVNMPGVRIHRIPRLALINSVKIGPSWPKLFLDILVLIKAFILLTKKKYDVIHSHEEAAFFCLFLARMFRVRHVYDMHSSLPKQLGNFNFGNWRSLVKLFELLEGLVLKTCDAVITIDEELEKYVKAKYPQIRQFLVENLALHTGRNPADPNFAREVRKSLGLNGKLPVVYTGSFESYQGLELLLESAEIVCRHDPKAIFILVGGKQDQIEQHRARVMRSNLQSSVYFMGIVPPEEAIAYLTIAEVLVSPRADGTSVPLKIYSYLHSGKPIVATKYGVHTQVLNDEIAFLSEPTKESLADGIL
ncbi:MAG TPA: glycosyltransferase, partial [Anaerolineales bacterium]|nr:glycosyltransferase [Anaerolineales bacterium]